MTAACVTSRGSSRLCRHEQIHRGPRQFSVLRARAGGRGRGDPVLDHRMGVPAGVATDPGPRRARHRSGGRRADPCVRAIRARGDRHAGPGCADASIWSSAGSTATSAIRCTSPWSARSSARPGCSGSRRCSSTAATMFVIFVAFVKGYEEPTLTDQFGAEYDAYRRSVPGWWPARHPMSRELRKSSSPGSSRMSASSASGRDVLGRIRPSTRGVSSRPSRRTSTLPHAGLQHGPVGVEQQRRGIECVDQPPVDPLVRAEPTGQHVRRAGRSGAAAASSGRASTRTP